MTSGDCIFCKIASGQVPSVRIYEDESVFAFLDIGPVSDGHTLVIPKQHFEKLHKCPAEILKQITVVLGRLAGVVADATGADGYNILCNNGPAAGQIVEHLHFHIIPRKDGDGIFDRWPSKTYEEGEMEAVAGRIRKNL